MPEISHVRIAVPDQGVLNRILREGGAQLFPQWLYAEPGSEPRILWWGIRGALATPDAEEAGASPGLFPRQVDDWTEAPRGLILATVDALTSLIEPLMIAVIGAAVGAAVIALYLPMFKIINLIK